MLFHTSILQHAVAAVNSPSVIFSGYLHDALTRLPRATNRNVHELTPENWAKARAASRRTCAAAA